MFRKFFSIGLLVGYLCSNVGSGVAFASTEDDLLALKQEIAQMRSEYEAKIGALEKQVQELQIAKASTQTRLATLTAQSTETAQKGLDLEYTGRDSESFGKGGVHIQNPYGFGQVTLGGYMDHEFSNFDQEHSYFDQHHWIINIGAEIHPRIRFYSELEIEHGGPDASGSGELAVEQAYMDYLINDMINVRGGAILVPFGRYNLYHDADLQDLTSRPLVARDVIPTTWTESGAGFFGEFTGLFNNSDMELRYEAYVINGLNDGFSDTGLSAAKGSLSSDNNNNKAVVGRVVISPALGHEVGFSAYQGRYDNLNNDITGLAVDWFSTWGPVEFVGEYANFDVDEPAGLDVANNFKGVNAQINYHFWPSFLDSTFLKRDFDHPTFTLIGRYDWACIQDDADTGFGDNEEDRWTLGLNYRPVEAWVFKVEYQWSQTENEALEKGDKDGVLVSAAMGF